MPPSLPRELIDQILNEVPDTDKHTLASCCLLNKSYLGSMRRRLYYSVDLELVSGDKGDNEPLAELWRPVDWRLSPSTLQLLATLQKSDWGPLASLVGAVTFSSLSGGQSCGICMTPAQLFSSVLELCPDLRDIQLPLYDDELLISLLATWYGANGGGRPEREVNRLDLRYPHDEMWRVLDCAAVHLDELVFSSRDVPWQVRGLPATARFQDPLELQTLHIHSTPGDLTNLLAVLNCLTQQSHGTLEDAILPFEPNFDLSPFTALSSLVLFFGTEEADIEDLGAVTRWVAAASSLRSLSFLDSLQHDLVELSAETGPLAHLAPSLVHLHLPADYPPDNYRHLLPKLARCPALRTVSYRPRPRWVIPACEEEEWNAVEEEYRAKGISLVRRPKDDDE
ncbi:hypothetical protein JCM6882_000911 [Rhodosporidiobolus microsporus]